MGEERIAFTARLPRVIDETKLSAKWCVADRRILQSWAADAHAEASMRLTDWIALISLVQNRWTFAALLAVLTFLYLTRKSRH